MTWEVQWEGCDGETGKGPNLQARGVFREMQEDSCNLVTFVFLTLGAALTAFDADLSILLPFGMAETKLILSYLQCKCPFAMRKSDGCHALGLNAHGQMRLF